MTEEPLYRRGGISPAQRLQALRGTHATASLPDAFIAQILDIHKRVAVTKDGVKFEHRGEAYAYWHKDSVVCADMVGVEILAKFDPCAPDVCYVLDLDGRLIDVLPAKNKVAWFDYEAAGREIASRRQAMERVEHQLKHVRRADIRAEHKRTQTNAERLQIVNTFPAPGASANQAPIPEATSRTGRGISFDRSEEVAQAVTRVAGQRVKSKARQIEKSRQAKTIGRDALESLLPEEGKAEIPNRSSETRTTFEEAEYLLDQLLD